MTGECTGLPTAPVLDICFTWVPRWGQVASVFGNLACFLLTEVRWMKAGQHLRSSIPIGAKELAVSICSMLQTYKAPGLALVPSAALYAYCTAHSIKLDIQLDICMQQ